MLLVVIMLGYYVIFPTINGFVFATFILSYMFFDLYVLPEYRPMAQTSVAVLLPYSTITLFVRTLESTNDNLCESHGKHNYRSIRLPQPIQKPLKGRLHDVRQALKVTRGVTNSTFQLRYYDNAARPPSS
jgi:hypothetical protein